MSRGRKTQTIGRITKRDGETMKCISHTGLITKANAQHYFNLNEKRINLLEKNNYITVHNVYTRQGIQTIYTLGTNGYKFIKEETTIDHTYKSNLRQVKHDIKLSQMYCQITPDERIGWKNENQIIHHWESMSKVERVGCLDAIVTIDNQIIGIEVITNNYGQEELAQKEEAAKALNVGKLVYINAR